jgi:uncharacterized lipoprotein YajG
MKITSTLLFLFVLAITGCALSPQVIVINPDIYVETSSVATKPTIVRLDVVDGRSSEFIGKRGGIYEGTSDISTDANMKASLERNLASALNNLGYMVARKNETSDAALTVRINKIEYTINKAKVLYTVETKVEIQAVCRKGSREFTGGYSAIRKKDFVKVPSMGQNETIVNEAMGVALQAMLNDKDLFSFIDG